MTENSSKLKKNATKTNFADGVGHTSLLVSPTLQSLNFYLPAVVWSVDALA